MASPIMPVAPERKAIHLQLIQDESIRYREALSYILHLREHILTLEKSFYFIISAADNLELLNFESYRRSILEFAKATWYLSDNNRELIFLM